MPRTAVGARHGRCATAATFLAKLRSLNLTGNKHIPASYLRADVASRRHLLSGLLDTDGTVAPTGQVQYTSTNRRLAEDVFDLVASLGYRPTLQDRPAKLDGRVVATAWTVGFTTADDVFGLARKQQVHAERRRPATPRTRLRYIVAVRPVPSRPVRCIQVANDSGLFLVTRSFIATHNSALSKRLVTSLPAFGITPMILGDTKPDYTRVVNYLGGQVVKVGRGLDRINPLDSGPLRQILPRLGQAAAEQLRLEIRGRRLSLLLALCTLMRNQAIDNGEEVILGRAIDLAADRLPDRDPTIPDVLSILEQGPDELRAAARATTLDEYRARVNQLAFTLTLLCEGSLKGVFDAPTSRPIDLNAPAVSVDISHVAAAGDTLVAAAMLCCWGYGFGLVDAATLAAERGLAPRRHYLAVLDELWRALRGAPGLVEHADALTRLNRQKGIASLMITHGLKDLEALATEADRAKAVGFIDRSAIKILAGLPGKELHRVGQIVRLTEPEREMVSSWASSDGSAGAVHPGRGKYLIKTGDHQGWPVAMSLVGDEWELYDTDIAIRTTTGGRRG
jgi:hypothetical protein